MNAPATTPQQPTVLDRLAALGEPTRARIALLLEARELTVSELCAVLQAPQSTVSRHLKSLADAGWVGSRPEGTRRFYRMEREALGDPARRLWRAVREDLASGVAARADRRRLAPVLAERRSRSEAFFSSEAGAWDRVRDELFGPGFFHPALAALVEPSWAIADLGCGTGQVAAALAPFVARVVAIDGSDAMLDEARIRLESKPNVEIARGDLESLPVEDGALDAALLVLVLHHVPDPAAALREVARTVRPGGRVLVVDLEPHDRDDLARRMGHVWLGFSREALEEMLGAAGFETPRIVPLPAAATAKGPSLFVATAVRRTD